MAIFYVLVAKKNNIVLCDYTAHTGNFQVITMQLLPQIQPDTSKTLELEDYHFHYTYQNGLLVLCMADKQVAQKLAFAFLQDVRNTMIDNYTVRELDTAKGYSLKSFGTQFLKPKMEMYNDNPHLVQDKADELLQNMLHLKDNMIENIDNLIQRDGKIEIIAEKAMSLSSVSNSYKIRSKKLKEQERRKRYCYIAVVVLLFIVCLFCIILAFLPKDDSSTSSKKPEPAPQKAPELQPQPSVPETKKVDDSSKSLFLQDDPIEIIDEEPDFLIDDKEPVNGRQTKTNKEVAQKSSGDQSQGQGVKTEQLMQ